MADFVIDVQVAEEATRTQVDGMMMALLETAVTAALNHCQLSPPATLTLLLTGDDHIRQLNRDYLGHDKPTDVLSFPAGDPMPGMVDRPVYLGDIIISVPFAGRQAQAAGHNLTAELQLLAVHGTLHLLGYDHAEPAEKEPMWGAQTAVLTRLGLPHIAPTET